VAWGTQGIKVTLEDTKTGEKLVIEPDGKINCQEKSDRSKAKQTERKTDKPESSSGAAATEKAGAKANPAAKPASEKSGGAAKPAKSVTRKAAARRGTSLKWSPVKDHGYHGFRAPSGGGYFKVLKAKATQWALFFEPSGADARHVGCFGKEDPAKTKAQELHDKGWPANEVRGVTAEDVARACPAPESEGKTEGRRPRMQRETKTETKAETPTTPAAPAAANEPPPPSASEAEKDKELMGSFTGELDNVLDEEDD